MKKTEYLIVGQGLAGTMLAFEMLERGMDFRIVASKSKSKASVVAAGMINPLVYKRLTKSWLADELLPEMEAKYRELERILGASFYFRKKILKPLSDQETTLWKEKSALPGFDKYIEDIVIESPVPGIKTAPAYGVVRGAGYLNLYDFLNHAKSFFIEKKLLFEKEFRFGSSAVFEAREFRAEKVVFCEGYHLRQNPLFDFVKMNPAKGEVLLIHAPGLSEEFILNKKVFVLPVGNQRFKVGSTYEWEDLSEQPTQKGKESILERLDELIKVEYTIENHWAGIRPTVSDRRPVLGQHPEHDNIFLFNGLGTKGVMLAPRFAREMCDFLTGTNLELMKEVDIKRFYK
ncbi:NAD(P)/FAD-dependent oxidoreductase [Maribellus sediminis]|uniref:NAD(P)/FAD-dependent oxidoreductase n=1 Tax=Maribellus sediminis TaxID=2696285 RepID=UPI0014320874|nr:FAD-dependent oxidoreductase [Maribellus sediminis]